MVRKLTVDQVVKQHGHLLDDFSSEKQWDQKDPFWQDLLAFPEPLMSFSPVALEEALLPTCARLVKNNGKTFNFQVLLQHLIMQLQEVNSTQSAQRAANTVTFVTVILKYLAETLNADDLVALLDAPQRMMAYHGRPSTQDDSWVNQIIAAVLLILTTSHIGNTTYLLHLSVMNLLLAVFSTQLYTASTASDSGSHPFLEFIMDNRQLAQRLTSVLLVRYSEFRPVPPNAELYQPVSAEPAGVFKLMRSAAVSILWLPVQAITFLARVRAPPPSDSPLAETSLLLLLVLVHQAPVPGHDNPFCTAIRFLRDNGQEAVNLGSESPPSVSRRDLAISFDQLYDSLGSHMDSEISVLLLYDLLHHNNAFREFIRSHRDLAALLLPVAKLLYSSSELNSSQMYMLLIVVLLLTQDAEISKRMHHITIPTVPWYQEQLLKEIPLGSLYIILLLSIAAQNLTGSKDMFLTQNAVAGVANLSPMMSQMAPLAASKLIKLIDALGRKIHRLNSSTVGANEADLVQEEIQFYVDFRRILLESMNAAILKTLPSNPELVYALLHRQEVFQHAEEVDHAPHLLDNAQLVINNFNHEIEAARTQSGRELDVSALLIVIREKLTGWPHGLQLRNVSELKFSYEEEASPEAFFVPYIWTLIVSHTRRSIAWRTEAIALFFPLESSDSLDTLDNLGSRVAERRPSDLHEALNTV